MKDRALCRAYLKHRVDASRVMARQSYGNARELEDIRYTRRRPHVKIAEQFLIALMTNSYRVSQCTGITTAYTTDAA